MSYDRIFTVCYMAWSLSLVERKEHLKLSIYFMLACVRGAPSQPARGRRLAYSLMEKEPYLHSTPRSRQVGAWVSCLSLPGEIQNMVGEAVACAR